jgi:hypothetical protein
MALSVARSIGVTNDMFCFLHTSNAASRSAERKSPLLAHADLAAGCVLVLHGNTANSQRKGDVVFSVHLNALTRVSQLHASNVVGKMTFIVETNCFVFDLSDDLLIFLSLLSIAKLDVG